MSTFLDIYTTGIVGALILFGVGAFIGAMNGSIEGWDRQHYQVMFAALAGFVAAPVWPLTLIALLVFFYRRAFPKPTPEDLDERIRRAEREAGLA